jgi:iron(III) transport system permease protein
VRTLTVSVYTTWLNRGSLAGAAEIACFMLAIVIALIALERRGRRDKGYGASTRRPRTTQPAPLPRGAGIAAAVACALPVLLGFLLPAGFLLKETMQRGLLAQIDAAFAGHLMTTVALAVAATVAALVTGIVVVTAARSARRTLTDAMTFAVGLGYAVPGTVLALGLIAPLVAVDNLLGGLWRALTGERLGLLLIGSGAAIVVAYTVRFLPIATGSLAAGLSRVSGSVEEAARSLGAKPRELVLRVQLPLIRPALASAALLVFVDCLKELPATLLLRPIGFETLATEIWKLTSVGAYSRAALPALVLILVSAPFVYLLSSRPEHEPEPVEHG